VTLEPGSRHDEEFGPLFGKYVHTDCTAPDLNDEQRYVCSEIRIMLQMLASVHRVSFANNTATYRWVRELA
jgi:hypothetical protein